MMNKRQINMLIVMAEIVILLAALGVRLIYFNQLRDIFAAFLDTKPFCGLDANAYHNYALGYLNGDWPDADYAYAHMILYAYYLSFFYGLVGVNLKLVAIIQILMEVTACAALYGIGRLVFNRGVGLMAGGLLAFYGPLIFFNPCFAQVALSIPLFTITVFLLLKAQTTNKWSYVLPAGLLTGLAVLSRPTFFLLIPIVFLWWLLNRLSFKRLILQTALYTGLVVLVTLPVTRHQIRAAGHFLPTPVSGWEILFLGNNPVAEGMGTLDHVLYTQLDLPGEAYVSTVTKAEVETSTAYRDEVLKFITTEPIKWLNLTGRKIYLFLAERDERIISPYFVHNFQSTPLLPYLPFTWRSVSIGALLGILLLKHNRRSWLLLLLLSAFILFTLSFHIQYRFRMLLVPIVLIYVTALIDAAPRLTRSRFMIALVVLAGLFPFLPELAWLLFLFVGFKLWPYVRGHNWPLLRWPALSLWSYFVVAILLSRTLAFANQSGQGQSIFLGPQVAGSIALGQSFLVACNGFNRVSLVLGDYQNNHPHAATFHLRHDKNNPDDLYTEVFDVTGIKDRTRHNFTFPAQANSAGQAYFFFIDAPAATLDEAITVRGAYDKPVNRYQTGQAYAGQGGQWQALSADLAFGAHCDTGLLDITHQSFQNLAAKTWGLASFYWILLISHLGLFVIAVYKLQKLYLFKK